MEKLRFGCHMVCGIGVYYPRIIITLFDTFMQKESEGVPERAKEQAPVGLLRDPNRLLSFSISSLLNPPIAKFSSVLGRFVFEAFAALHGFSIHNLVAYH